MTELRVVPYRRFEDLAPRAAEIDLLNLASRRPCPFATYEYIRAFLDHDEYARRDDEVLFLAALEGERLVGYLPLRRRRERILGVPCLRIGVLVDHDTDRPHAVARAEDEARCCEAFYRHLVDREPGWTFLELAFQDAASGLQRTPPLPAARFHSRRFETMPNTTVPLPFRTFAAYYASLNGRFRGDVSRACRRVLAAGRVEVIASGDPRARLPLLDLYLDVERRSWKQAAGDAGIARDERRLAFFRRLCDPDQPLALHFDLVLLDGLPIAGMLGGTYGGGDYALETTFDDDYQDVSPGSLLWLMAMRSAVSRGVRSYNLDGNYAYYKSRWGGTVTETSAIQIYRVPSIHWLKARSGELLRRLRPRRAAPEISNPARQRASARDGAGAGGRERRPERGGERERARASLAALSAAGVRVERLSGDDLAATLPFDVRRGAA